jgi:hypothetical protein
VGAIVPTNRFGLAKPQIGFVDYGGGLKRVLAVFAAHLAGGNSMQLAIDQFHEPVGGFVVSGAPLPEERGNAVRIGRFLHIANLIVSHFRVPLR